MPFLSFFADEQDAKTLLNWLNAEHEIAFTVQDPTQTSKQRKWKAVQTINQFIAEQYSLWHIPTGLLPLDAEGQTISNPWDGWIELLPGADSRVPYFWGSPAKFVLSCGFDISLIRILNVLLCKLNLAFTRGIQTYFQYLILSGSAT